LKHCARHARQLRHSSEFAKASFGECGLDRRIKNVSPGGRCKTADKSRSENRERQDFTTDSTLARGTNSLRAQTERPVNDNGGPEPALGHIWIGGRHCHPWRIGARNGAVKTLTCILLKLLAGLFS
jgi:hypothetical protein